MTKRPVDILFPEAQREAAIGMGFCVLPPIGCGQPVTGFRDALSEKEYGISGWCQTCQDRMWS
jgi:hypothetical protein